MTVNYVTAHTVTEGDGSNTSFGFTWTTYSTDDLLIQTKDVNGTVTTITEGTGVNNYSVVLSTPNSLPSTGTVTYPASGTANVLAASEYITIRRQPDIEQTLDLMVQQGYDPETLEITLDKIVMICQALEDTLDLAVKTDNFDITGVTAAALASDLDFVVTNWSSIETAIDALNTEPHKTNLATVAAAIANINTVAGIDADITTVAGISADVTSVAGILPLGGAASENVAAGGVGDLLREDGDGGALTGITDTEFALSADISPSQLTANTDNWNPSGLSTASTIRFSTDASRDITGIAGGADGRILVLHNIGSNNAVLKNDATSTAANRFLTPGASDFTLGQQESVAVQYDSTSSRWRVLSVADSSTTGAWTLIGTATASASASITVTGIDATYPTYAIIGEDLHPATDGAFPRLRFGDSGGVDSGGSDYKSYVDAGDISTTGSFIDLIPNNTSGIGGDAGEGVSFDGKIHSARGSQMYAQYSGQSTYVQATGDIATTAATGRRVASITTDRVNFSFSTGNITSGRITVWGISST